MFSVLLKQFILRYYSQQETVVSGGFVTEECEFTVAKELLLLSLANDL